MKHTDGQRVQTHSDSKISPTYIILCFSNYQSLRFQPPNIITSHTDHPASKPSGWDQDEPNPKRTFSFLSSSLWIRSILLNPSTPRWRDISIPAFAEPNINMCPSGVSIMKSKTSHESGSLDNMSSSNYRQFPSQEVQIRKLDGDGMMDRKYPADLL